MNNPSCRYKSGDVLKSSSSNITLDADIEVKAGTDGEVATEAAAGAAIGVGLWGLMMPAANFIGFTSTGITGGSTAAAMMSSAAVANGGGVASGSVVAILQSIGAVGLATPVGLSLVVGGAAVGGASYILKSILSKNSINEIKAATGGAEDEEKSIWVLAEIMPETKKLLVRVFSDNGKAHDAFLHSSATSKVLFDPEKNVALEQTWDHSIDKVVFDFYDTSDNAS